MEEKKYTGMGIVGSTLSLGSADVGRVLIKKQNHNEGWWNV